ncbi:DUF1003 domain-containing protein [archaeon]|jgi:uncharacterized membrane protein|nr:DUF1003 domain-containing protein [archaeon]MBT4417544.1 DUF1003 domain-containing protein [archaeon]
MKKKVIKKTKPKSKKIKPQHPVFKTELTFGQKSADLITKFCGSWTFILMVIGFIIVWMTLNSIAFLFHWDPWPFIILNLCLSCLAALQAPVILMSQNRGGERDRINLKYDYQVNRRAEREITKVHKELETIKGYLYKNLKGKK